MRLYMNGVAFPDAEVALYNVSYDSIEENGMTLETVQRWEFGGKALAASQDALTVEIAARFALMRDGSYIELKTNAGRKSFHSIGGAGSLQGVKVHRFWFPEGTNGEYSNWRTWRAAVSATYVNLDVKVRKFSENIAYSGGGPRIGFREILNGLPIPQTLSPARVYTAIQSGIVVGRFGYIIPTPAVAGGLLVDKDIDYGNAERRGLPNRPVGTDYPITYRFVFQSSTPMIGLPRQWLQ